MRSLPIRIGVIGTGFVSRHFVKELANRPAYRVSKVLTRRPIDDIAFPQPQALTGDLEDIIRESDIIVECTGDVRHAAQTIPAILQSGKPVATLNPEFHVTVGSAFEDMGYLTEAEGDQPGCEAALVEEARTLGFEPLVFGNMKGFLNRHPTPKDMAYWAERQGISMPMVTSFTDGTKLQVEQALVANGLGGDIAQRELIGLASDDLNECAAILGAAAEKIGRPIADYVLSRVLPHGVFVVAKHKEEQRDALRYLKLGDGPYYLLQKTNIFVHLELFKTLERIIEGKPPLLTNSARPRVSVAAIAKRTLLPGERIERGCGSFEMRGVCIAMHEAPDHLPIGLAEEITVARKVEPGQMLTLADVELPPSAALDAWHRIVRSTSPTKMPEELAAS